MEIILRIDIPKLGKAYDVIKVKSGFARNYLLPKGLAFKVTKFNLEQIEKEKKSKTLIKEKEKRRLEELAKGINAKSYTIPVATNAEEKLYASVSIKDIVEAIKVEGIDIKAENVILSSPLKELGIYEVNIRFEQDIAAKIKIWVVKK